MDETFTESPCLAGVVTTSGFPAEASEPGAPLLHKGTTAPFDAPKADEAKSRMSNDFVSMNLP